MHYPKDKTSFSKAKKWLDLGLPFALYRLPQEREIKGIYQNDKTLVVLENFAQRGFVFAPFHSQNTAPLLRPDTVETYVYEPWQPVGTIGSVHLDESKLEHLALVERAISEIEIGKLEKVVLSRQIKVAPLEAPFNTFRALLTRYTNALVYFFHHPKAGTWMGATPERLLEIQDKKLFTTSLAGTLPVEDNISPKWTPKEIHEQQVVTDFIKQSLARHVSRLQIGDSQSVQSGSIWHLKTEIEAEVTNVEDVEEIVRELHPTPAVCGTPRKAAMEFILENEQHKREYYTGFLGELNLQKPEALRLYVNLRCMKLAEDGTYIFVGGGITADSDPEKEWMETQAKSRTMLDAI